LLYNLGSPYLVHTLIMDDACQAGICHLTLASCSWSTDFVKRFCHFFRDKFSSPLQYNLGSLYFVHTLKIEDICPFFYLNFISTYFQFHSSWLCRRQARHRSVSTLVIYVFMMWVSVIVWKIIEQVINVHFFVKLLPKNLCVSDICWYMIAIDICFFNTSDAKGHVSFCHHLASVHPSFHKLFRFWSSPLKLLWVFPQKFQILYGFGKKTWLPWAILISNLLKMEKKLLTKIFSNYL
jgi:hypothetical protein